MTRFEMMSLAALAFVFSTGAHASQITAKCETREAAEQAAVNEAENEFRGALACTATDASIAGPLRQGQISPNFHVTVSCSGDSSDTPMTLSFVASTQIAGFNAGGFTHNKQRCIGTATQSGMFSPLELRRPIQAE